MDKNKQNDSLKQSKILADTILIRDVKDEAGKALIGFLKFYLTDDSVKYYENKIVLPDAYGDPNYDSTICFYGDTTNERKYLKFLNRHQFLTKEFLLDEKRAFDSSNVRQLKLKQPSKSGPPMEFCYERVFCGQIFPKKISELEGMRLIKVRLPVDTEAYFTIYETGSPYQLVKRNGKWLLNKKCMPAVKYLIFNF